MISSTTLSIHKCFSLFNCLSSIFHFSLLPHPHQSMSFKCQYYCKMYRICILLMYFLVVHFCTDSISDLYGLTNTRLQHSSCTINVLSITPSLEPRPYICVLISLYIHLVNWSHYTTDHNILLLNYLSNSLVTSTSRARGRHDRPSPSRPSSSVIQSSLEFQNWSTSNYSNFNFSSMP